VHASDRSDRPDGCLDAAGRGARVVKGRRAADRRRERQGKQGKRPIDDRGQTMPGVDPLPSDDESDEADGHDPDGDEHGPDGPDERDLPLVSQVREIEPEGPGAPELGGTTPGRRGRSVPLEPENDPEASFVKAVRMSQDERRPLGEVTAVKPAPNKPPLRGAHLFVLEGPDSGGETDIEVTPSLLGRLASAEIGLSDPSISRRHCELTLTDDGWVLLDLGSTSGTLVNGKLALSEVLLRHGDVISIGKTDLRFTRAARIPEPRPEPEPDPQAPIESTEKLPAREKTKTRQTLVVKAAQKPPGPDPAVVRARVRRTTTRIIAACAVLFVALVLGRATYRGFFDDKAPAQIRAQVATLLADGRLRLLAQDVDGARAAAETVLALDPENEDATSLLKMALTEAEARDAIALALRLGDEERDVEAGQILRRVADASVFAPTRDRLRRTLDERGMVRSRRHAESLLDQGRMDEAVAAAEKHVATWPNDEAGRLVQERVLAAQKSVPKNPALAAARAAFREGDIAAARQIATDARLAGFLRDLDELEGALAKGKAALKRFDEDAAASLDTAFRLLGALGATPSSPIFADVRKPYADALYLAGTAKLEESPCAGARELFRASRVMAEDPKIQAKLRELDLRAVSGLERARGARAQDPERAAALAREHLCFARLGTRTYDELRALSRL
jgi:pSer/pThr/pTyr-binding forkhead associated (FHA) protein/tetratricopeptide (TPR) repeat protein